jgi:hypothetical protein
MPFEFVVATTTWNSIDLVEPFLAHLRKLGARAVLVMDYDSDDGTRAVLDSERWAGFVHRIPFPGLASLDPSNVTLAVARERFPGAWCLFCDPDEFLACDGMDLRATAAREGWEGHDLVRILRRNMTAPRSRVDDIGRLPFPAVFTLRIEARSERSQRERLEWDLATPWIFTAIPEKVLVRLAACERIGDGDHVATVASDRSMTSASARLLHYPFRTYAQFAEKVRNAAVDLSSNPHLPPGFAWHWRRWIDLQRNDALEREYLDQFIDDAAVGAMVASGALVEDRSVADFDAPDARVAAPPRVSVVVPYWNAEEFLLETLDSVKRQTFAAWELILVDDGSTDGSARVAAAFAAGDPDRIRCVAHPGNVNRGQSASRNLGLALARGDLVAFLDADDVWNEDKLAVQVGILDAHPDVDVTFGPYFFWHTWSGHPDAKDVVAALGSGADYDRPLDPPYLVWRHVAHGNGIPVPSSALIRTAAVRRIGGFEANDFPGMYDDESFFAKLLVQGKAWVHAQPLDKYRQHPRSFCARAIEAGTWDPRRNADVPDRRRVLEWLAAHCRAADLEPASRDRLVAAVEQRIGELVPLP